MARVDYRERMEDRMDARLARREAQAQAARQAQQTNPQPQPAKPTPQPTPKPDVVQISDKARTAFEQTKQVRPAVVPPRDEYVRREPAVVKPAVEPPRVEARPVPKPEPKPAVVPPRDEYVRREPAVVKPAVEPTRPEARPFLKPDFEQPQRLQYQIVRNERKYEIVDIKPHRYPVEQIRKDTEIRSPFLFKGQETHLAVSKLPHLAQKQLEQQLAQYKNSSLFKRETQLFAAVVEPGRTTVKYTPRAADHGGAPGGRSKNGDKQTGASLADFKKNDYQQSAKASAKSKTSVADLKRDDYDKMSQLPKSQQAQAKRSNLWEDLKTGVGKLFDGNAWNKSFENAKRDLPKGVTEFTKESIGRENYNTLTDDKVTVDDLKAALSAAVEVGAGRVKVLKLEGKALQLTKAEEQRILQLAEEAKKLVAQKGNGSFTDKQLAALDNHPNLKPAFTGTAIDLEFKKLVKSDPLLKNKFDITPQGKKGPDLVAKNGQEWVDITTQKQAKAHFDKYGNKTYGQGTVVTHDTKTIIKQNDAILKAKNDWQKANKAYEAAKAAGNHEAMKQAEAEKKAAEQRADAARRAGGTIKATDNMDHVQQKNTDIMKAKQDWEQAHKDWEAARARNDQKGMNEAKAREKAAHDRAEKARREGGTTKESMTSKDIVDKNKEIKEAKEAWERAKARNDEKGMKEAHEKAEKARREGGTIREKDTIKDVEEKNERIREAKREWEKAKERGDEKGMKEAHEKAEKARREGGTIK